MPLQSASRQRLGALRKFSFMQQLQNVMIGAGGPPMLRSQFHDTAHSDMLAPAACDVTSGSI
jgi:hypothetical protein